MKIFLIGYMGCGKSFLGKRLAESIGFDFLDLDVLIEEQQQMTIPQIFDKFGESGFREREHQALVSLKNRENLVVATGGGAPCFNDNMEWMNRSGKTVFLQVAIDILADRILNSEDERPLVRNKSKEELLQYIERHLELRLPFYLMAQHIFSHSKQNLQDLIDLLKLG